MLLLLATSLSLQALMVEARSYHHKEYQLPAEWHLWKSQHRKSYVSEREELFRHAVWQSNKKFIDAHNRFNQTFGFTLAMNELGDLV